MVVNAGSPLYAEPPVQEGQVQERFMRIKMRPRPRPVLQHQSVQDCSGEKVHTTQDPNDVGSERGSEAHNLLL